LIDNRGGKPIIGAVDHRGGRRPPDVKDNPAVALQDLLAHTWLHFDSDRRAADDTRRHERSLWCHPCDAGPSDRRPPPSGRMGAAHMPRGVFLALAFGWGAAIAIRWIG
jgi:hypothetical protein